MTFIERILLGHDRPKAKNNDEGHDKATKPVLVQPAKTPPTPKVPRELSPSGTQSPDIVPAQKKRGIVQAPGGHRHIRKEHRLKKAALSPAAVETNTVLPAKKTLGVVESTPSTPPELHRRRHDDIEPAHEELSESEAGTLVAELKLALDPQSKLPELSRTEADALYGYHMGTTPLPSDYDESRRILRQLALYQQKVLVPRQLRHYKTWLKTPEGIAALAESTKKDAEFEKISSNPQSSVADIDAARERIYKVGPLTALGTAYRRQGSGADDLPAPSPFLELVLAEDQGLLMRARNTFMLALQEDLIDRDTSEGKLCHVFGQMLKFSDRSHKEANQNTMRQQMDNASRVLLSYGIVYPRVESRESRDGTRRTTVGFGVNKRVLHAHAEHFLTQQRCARLDAAIQNTNDNSEKNALQLKRKALDAAKSAADAFIGARAQSLDIKSPATVFEAFGNRLWVTSEKLPVFEEPQSGDSSPVDEKKMGVGDRSLDAAIAIFASRERPDEAKFKSLDLELRAGEFTRVLNIAANDVGETKDAVETIQGALGYPETRIVALRTMKQIIDRVSDLRRISDACERTLEKEVAPESLALRKRLFEAPKKYADELLATYEAFLSEIGVGIFAPQGREVIGQKSLEDTESENRALRELFVVLVPKLTQIEKALANKETAPKAAAALRSITGHLSTVTGDEQQQSVKENNS